MVRGWGRNQGYIAIYTKGIQYWCCDVCMLMLCITWTELMKESASMFQSQATRLKRKLWWQNVKLWIILIVIILIILAIIVSESVILQ
jgi:hypothetical protein